MGRFIRTEKGFSLVELMVAMVLSLVASAGIYKSFISFATVSDSQERIDEMQQNIRIGTNRVVRDLRMAGYDFTGKAGAGFAMSTTQFSLMKFSMDLSENGVIGNDETVSYRFDKTNRQLDRKIDNGLWKAQIDNVNALEFRYFEENGTTPAMSDQDTRVVQIAMVVQTAEDVPSFTDTKTYTDPLGNILLTPGDYKKFTHRPKSLYVTRVNCRNMGL